MRVFSYSVTYREAVTPASVLEDQKLAEGADVIENNVLYEMNILLFSSLPSPLSTVFYILNMRVN